MEIQCAYFPINDTATNIKLQFNKKAVKIHDIKEAIFSQALELTSQWKRNNTKAFCFNHKDNELVFVAKITDIKVEQEIDWNINLKSWLEHWYPSIEKNDFAGPVFVFKYSHINVHCWKYKLVNLDIEINKSTTLPLEEKVITSPQTPIGDRTGFSLFETDYFEHKDIVRLEYNVVDLKKGSGHLFPKRWKELRIDELDILLLGMLGKLEIKLRQGALALNHVGEDIYTIPFEETSLVAKLENNKHYNIVGMLNTK